MWDLNEHIDGLQEKIGYTFNKDEWAYKELTKSLYPNEYLKLMGGKILDEYVERILDINFGLRKKDSRYYNNQCMNEYFRVANKKEKKITDLKHKIISNRTLAERIDKLGFKLCSYMEDIEWKQKVKSDLFKSIVGAVAIDGYWDYEKLYNVIDAMFPIDECFKDIDVPVPYERTVKFKLKNVMGILKELADRDRYYRLKYYVPNKQIEQDGKYWWPCTVSFNRIYKVALGRSKKDAQNYAAHLVLCSYYGLINEVFDLTRYNLVDYGRWGYCSPPGVGIPMRLN